LIRNLKLEIRNFSRGFTLIEMVVVLGISVILMTAVGGVMTSSFRAKNSTLVQETVQNEAKLVMDQLKKNVFDAGVNTDDFFCPIGVGTSISFNTKSDGKTYLTCYEGVKIASESANGDFLLTNSGVSVRNCDSFVTCQKNSDLKVMRVDFNLDMGITGGTGDQFWTFVSKVTVR